MFLGIRKSSQFDLVAFQFSLLFTFRQIISAGERVDNRNLPEKWGLSAAGAEAIIPFLPDYERIMKTNADFGEKL
jgi:hypothetical protein